MTTVLGSRLVTSQIQNDKSVWFLEVSLELFYKLDGGVTTKSMELPRTFYIQYGKDNQTDFLVLYGARGAYNGP